MMDKRAGEFWQFAKYDGDWVMTYFRPDKGFEIIGLESGLGVEDFEDFGPILEPPEEGK